MVTTRRTRIIFRQQLPASQDAVININYSYGYTLIEMMIVMLITAAAGMGAMQGWQQRQHLLASVSHVRQFLLQLRRDASWHNRNHQLNVKPGTDWCISSKQVAADKILCAPWPDVELAEATSDTSFYGERDVARPGSLTFRNRSGTRRVIVSSRGRVRICQPDEKECDL